VGTPLKDWDINIYRGVLTGYNEAFIISTDKRNEILSNCTTEEERAKTEELIRPILRGRDIKRYGYDWAGLWLINTHNGVKGRIPRIDINDYPAVKAHLDQYWDKIERRADQGDTPYNLRNCAYLEDFNKPKIIYNIAQSLTFAMSTNGEYLNNTAYFFTGIESELNLLLKVLNSKVLDWYYRTLSVQLGERAVRMFSIYVLKIPIPKERIVELFDVDDEFIDSTMCSIYGLTDIERQVIGVQ
jgi:type II restriction/modification system DNA methylase subunit YeeA